jgi:hypothetical protein
MSENSLKSINPNGGQSYAFESPANLAPTSTNPRYINPTKADLAQQHLSRNLQSPFAKLENRLEKVASQLANLIEQSPLVSQNKGSIESLFNKINSQLGLTSPLLSQSSPLGSIDKLLQKPKFENIKKSALDESAFVFNKGVASEPEQVRLVKASIESADKFAAVTTYGIKPIERNGKLTNTMHAVIAGVAQKQSDPEFNFVFLYNKSEFIQNKVTGGKRTQVSLNEASTKQQQWGQVLDAYNKQAVDEYNQAIDKGIITGNKIASSEEFSKIPQEQLQNLVQAGHLTGLPITDLKAKVFVVAADPHIAGSHHNKFCINDSGFAATLGASIGNTSKPSWFDSGAVTLSKKLASSQRDYLLHNLLPEAKHIGQLTYSGGQAGVIAALTHQETSAVRNSLEGSIGTLEIKEPFASADGKTLNGNLERGLKHSGFLKADEPLLGHAAKVAWIQNTGSILEPIGSKPIAQALEHLFKEAKSGDTILLRNNAFNERSQALALEALKKGVNVKLLAPTRTKAIDAGALFNDIQHLTKKVDALRNQEGLGKFEVHVFNPNTTIKQAHDFDPGGRPVNDHAKVYALQRKDPGTPSLLLTGTHNLDGQSFKRSHENMMLMESTDTHLTSSLFDEFWQNTPEVSRDDINGIVENFHKPALARKKPFEARIEHSTNPQSEALLKKIGLR